MRLYLDANFFIFAAFDETTKGKNARSILQEIIGGKKHAITSILALDEVMWVLLKNKMKDELEKHIKEIYRIPNLEIITGSPLIPLRAIDSMNGYNLKPRDAFHVAFMGEEHTTVIVSDDNDFDRVKGIQRIPL